MTELAELLLLLPVAVEQIELVGRLGLWVFQEVQTHVHEVGIDVDQLQPCLDVLLHHEILLEVVPEAEGILDHVPVLVTSNAFEKGLDKGSEATWLAGDGDDPSVSGICEDPRDSLEGCDILVVCHLLDERPQFDHPGQEGLYCFDVVVHVSRLPADGSQALCRRLPGLLVGDAIHHDSEERRVDDGTDGHLP